MGSIQIPPKRNWSGVYSGDYDGILWKTFNIDLDRKEGDVCLSKRLTTVADTTGTTDSLLNIIDAFVRTDADCTDRYWGLAFDSQGSSRMYRSADSNPAGTWALDTLATSPNEPRDMVVYERDTLGDTSRQQLFVTEDTHVSVLNDTGNRDWKSLGAAIPLQSGFPHPIDFWSSFPMMMIGDKSNLHTVSRVSTTTNEVVTLNRLQLATDLVINHVFSTATRAWLLCAGMSSSGTGRIGEWDGRSQFVNALHNAYAQVPLAGVNWREIPIVLNNKGMFLEFTGNGFAPMYRNGKQIAFPIAFEPENYWQTSEATRFTNVRPRGMSVGPDGLIYIAVANPTQESLRQGGGIWCLNPITGRLYLKHSIGSWANTSYGEQRTRLGAVYPITTGSNLSNTTNFLIGGTYNNNDVNFDRTAIWTLSSLASTTASRGYFITQYIHSEQVREFWDSLWLKFLRFGTTTNRIVVKARGIRPLKDTFAFPVESNITWVNATSFTVQLDAAEDALAVGDEVEVISGVNSGTLSHITVISGVHAAVQTITIDETLTASTNTARARFDRWKKLGVVSNDSKYEESMSIGIKSSFIQFKVELRGPVAEMELNSLIVNSETDVYLKK